MEADFLSLAFHRSVWPQQLIKGMRDSLKEGCLPGWWLYHGTQQVLRWQEYQAGHAPAATQEKKLFELYRQASIWIAREALDRPVQVVSLGAGDGIKDAMLVDALLAGGGRKPQDIIYTPMDISPSLCVQALHNMHALQPDVSLHALVVLLDQNPRLRPWLMQHETSIGVLGRAIRIITCFGMFPNMRPQPFAAWLRRLVRYGDFLLVSTNLSPPMEKAVSMVLPQYDNPLARSWYQSGLESLGVGRQKIRLDIQPQALNEDDKAWQVQVMLTSMNLKHRLKIEPFASLSMELKLESPLLVFFSNRFEAKTFEALLAQEGFAVSKRWLEEEACWEGVFACSPLPPGIKNLKSSSPELRIASPSS